MDGTSIGSEFQNVFSKSSLTDWKRIAAQEANGEDPFEKLLWRGKDHIAFLPYYDAACDTELQFVRQFALQPTTNAQRQWFNLPLVKSNNPSDANALALEHLMNGAEGVVCDLRAVVNPELKVLTNNIEWSHCYIGFYSDENPLFLQNLRDIVQKKYIPASVNGALFWESIPKTTDLAFYFDNCPSFRALGLLIAESSPADEVSNALLNGVKAFETFNSHGSHESVFRSVAFSLSADVTLLETVAKFKAMRILWFQVARAYGLVHYKPSDLFIHARSTHVSDAAFGPHENMIKGTFAAIGALIGGCDALTVESDGSTSFTTRCARNVSSILREESFFDRAADPLAGAWAVEALTKTIAEKAWSIFQEKYSAYATA